MYRYLLSIIFLLIYALPAFAQLTLTGRIFDEESSEGLEYAQIVNESQGRGTYSSLGGKFILEAVSVGDSLSVQLLGYKTYSLVLDTVPSTVNLRLVPTVYELDQVLISPTQEVLKELVAIDVEENPINSSQEILRKVPGLIIGQHAGGGKAEQIFLRGFDIDHGTDLQLSVDGIPVNMVSHAHGQGYADLHFLIPETIENLDFGKGPYYADKGNFATAGYVDFQTKEKLSERIAKLEFGSFNSRRALVMMNVLPQRSSADAYIAAEYMTNDGPFESPQNFRRLNLFGKYRRQIGEGHLEIQASSFSSEWEASGQIPLRAVRSGMITRFGAIDDKEGGNTSRQNLSIQMKSTLGETSFLTTHAYYSRYTFDLFSNFTFFLNDPVNGDKIRQREVRNLYGFQSDVNRYVNLGNIGAKFRAGIGSRYDDIPHSELSRTKIDRSPLQKTSLAEISEMNNFAFFEGEFRKGKWMINSGLRLDHFYTQVVDVLAPNKEILPTSLLSLNPKLNTVFTPSTRWQLYAKSGKGFHSNAAIAVNSRQGNQVLPGAYGVDIGTIFKPMAGLYIDMALWYLFMQEEFVYVGDEGIIEPSGRTRRRGIDIGIRYQPRNGINADFAINYSDPRFVDEEEGGQYVPLAPGLSSVGGIKLDLKENFSTSLRYRYLADRPANEFNTLEAEGYFLSDLVFTYSLQSWTLALSIENLFNEAWSEAQFETESQLKGEAEPVSEIHLTPGSPRALKVGLIYRF